MPLQQLRRTLLTRQKHKPNPLPRRPLRQMKMVYKQQQQKNLKQRQASLGLELAVALQVGTSEMAPLQRVCTHNKRKLFCFC